VMTLLATFTDAHAASVAVGAVVGRGLRPRCIEFLDAGTLAALRAGGHPVDERAGALLIVEVDGEEAICATRAERVGEALADQGALDVLMAREGRQRETLWTARREMSMAVRRMSKKKLSEDVVVPRIHLPELLTRVERTTETERLRSVAYGHAGDGNLHVNYLWEDDEQLVNVEAAVERLFRDVVELGGTLSGEHGIGVTKAPYLPLEQSSELIELQRSLKRVFDPAGLLNPGKIFTAASHRAC
jgi:glycolate oxidase